MGKKNKPSITLNEIQKYTEEIVVGIFGKEYTPNNSQTQKILIKMLKKLKIYIENVK